MAIAEKHQGWREKNIQIRESELERKREENQYSERRGKKKNEKERKQERGGDGETIILREGERRKTESKREK